MGAVGGVGGPAESSRAAPASKLKLRWFFSGAGSQTQFKSASLLRKGEMDPIAFSRSPEQGAWVGLVSPS